MKKVLLIGAEDEENLAIRYLGSALVKEGFEVRIAPCSRREDFPSVVKSVREFNPELIGISMAFQCLANMFFDMVSEIRKSGYSGHITAGGHFATFEYKKILETQAGIDSVIRFEGERAMAELAKSLGGELSSVNNLVYRESNGLKENKCVYEFQILDNLPFPLRSDRPQTRLGENFATLISSRGCWHSSCLYCCIGAFHSKKEGRKYCLRSPQSIAKEMSGLYHDKNVRLFQFHDDNFMTESKEQNLKRFREIKLELEKQKIDTSGIAFLIKARPDTVDEDIASLLNELGVVGIFLGIENASESGLKSLCRGSTVKSIQDSLDALKDYAMAITYNLLIFHPNATLDEINENIFFVKKHPYYPFDFGRAEIVAGSPLERLVIQEKLLKGEWPNWDYKIKDEAVDQMFRINLATFRREGSNYSKLAHSLIALSYHAYAVNRLYPGESSKNILLQTNELIKKSNMFTVDKIMEMYRLTAELKSEEEIDGLFNSISKGCGGMIHESDELNIRMRRLQVAEKKFKEFGVSDSVQSMPKVKSLFRI